MGSIASASPNRGATPSGARRNFALLSPAFLDELRARIALSAVVGRSVRLTKAGNEYKACCPFHQEKTPSFWVNDQKAFYHCFGCGAHGDAIRFLTETSGLSFMDAVKQLAESAGMGLPTPEPAEIARQQRSAGLVDVTEAAARHFEQSLAGAAGGAARSYLDQRGISAETRTAFRVGFAPDERNGVGKALAEAGTERLVEAGLLIQVEDKAPYDRFRGRVMIPIRDPRGRVIAFGGRILGPGEPKYLNSPDTPLFDKGRVLFNLDRAAPASRQTGRLLVVEGYMDVLALDQAGIREAVAPMGTALTEHQLELLWRQVDEPILCFDGDSAGKRAAARAAERALPLLSPGKQLRFALLPEKQDPDDFIRTRGRDAFEQLLAAALPLAEFAYASERAKIDPVRPEQRAGLRKRLEELAQSCGDRLVADEFARSFRRMFNDEFAWRPEHRKAILSAAIRTSPRIAPDLARSPLRSALHGLTRFPQLVAENLHALGALRIDHPDLARWRETLIEAALTNPDLDEDGLAAILQINLLPETLQWDVQSDLRFGFMRGSEPVERSVAQLRALVRHLGEEQGLGTQGMELDEAALADAAGDDYERIAADLQQVRSARASLLQRSAEWDLDLEQAI
ncbi:MAG TPA: DNA primase [Allosphingosinicella sp.]|jgi:DNA primase|uniref:DNA primase n=1 Tax=Allosphingosinicella sp. TaxID=2823234 RepID=UPI002F278E36